MDVNVYLFQFGKATTKCYFQISILINRLKKNMVKITSAPKQRTLQNKNTDFPSTLKIG